MSATENTIENTPVANPITYRFTIDFTFDKAHFEERTKQFAALHSELIDTPEQLTAFALNGQLSAPLELIAAASGMTVETVGGLEVTCPVLADGVSTILRPDEHSRISLAVRIVPTE